MHFLMFVCAFFPTHTLTKPPPLSSSLSTSLSLPRSGGGCNSTLSADACHLLDGVLRVLQVVAPAAQQCVQTLAPIVPQVQY